MRYAFAFLVVVSFACVTFAGDKTFFLVNGTVVSNTGETYDPPASVAVAPPTPVRTAVKRLVQVCENGVCRMVEVVDMVAVPQAQSSVSWGPALPTRLTSLSASDGTCPCGCGLTGCACGMTGRTVTANTLVGSPLFTATPVRTFLSNHPVQTFLSNQPVRTFFGRFFGGCR